MSSQLQDPWPLVGRHEELDVVREAILHGRNRSIVLAGPSGVGKTRLARECVAIVDNAGMTTLWVTATRSNQATPFGAFVPLLPADLSDPASALGYAELFHRATDALLAIAGDRGLALFVDDAHLLDPSSANLVRQLVVSGSALVLATVRTEGQAPDAVTALWKDEQGIRLDVRGLNTDDIEKLVSSVLGGQLDRATAAYLATHCQGKPLFLKELVLGAIADGSLRRDLGVWTHSGPVVPSQRVIELVESRLAGLDQRSRELLELVAYGEPLGQAELTALGDPSLAVELERQGLLTSRFDGRRLKILMGHPLYGDVLRSRMPAVRAADIARRLAETVERTGMRRREDTLRVGMWRLEGGGGQPSLMLAAAAIARWHYDFPLAERLAKAATGAGFDAAILAAQCAALQGRTAEAEQQLSALVSLARDDSQHGRLAIVRIDNLIFALGRLTDGLRVADEAAGVIADPDLGDIIAARRCGAILGMSGPRAALDAVTPVKQRATGLGLAWAHLLGSFSLGRLGRIGDALSAADAGRTTQLAVLVENDWYLWFHAFVRCEALCQAGRIREAEALARDYYTTGINERNREERAFFNWHLARVAIERGHVRDAAHHAREGTLLFRQLGRPAFEHSTLACLALAQSLMGLADPAADSLVALESLRIDPLWTGVDVLQAHAWAAVAAGSLAKGRALLTEAAALGERIGDLTGAASALHGIARLGGARAITGRLDRLTSRLEGDLIATRAAHTRSLAACDAKELDHVSRIFEDMGADLFAAEAAADAALAWQRTARPREASRARRRATDLTRRCPGARTPALRLVETPPSLTRSENDVALLAAGGLSNREMADKLVVSRRTIENHLQHIYKKLGISSRKELNAILGNSRVEHESGPS